MSKIPASMMEGGVDLARYVTLISIEIDNELVHYESQREINHVNSIVKY